MLLLNILRQQRSRCVSKSSSRLGSNPARSWVRFLQTQASNERFRILFMGRDEFSCLVLQELYRADDVWRELVIATHPDIYIGRRGSILSVAPLKELGETLKLPIYTIPQEKKEFRKWTFPPPFTPSSEAAGPSPPPINHLLVTASFGRILSERMLNLFQPGRRLNVHPSLLPAYRGPAPIQHSILNDEKDTGVCVIEMLKKREGIDAGSLWGCRKMDMPKNATFPTLRDELAVEGGKLLVSVLRDMMNGKAVARAQTSADNAPKAPMILPEDFVVDFQTMTAEDIFRRHRAISHQKPLITQSDGKSLQLLDLSPADPADLTTTPTLLSSGPGSTTFVKARKTLLVQCAAGSVLSVTRVKPENKPERDAIQFWNGLRDVRGGAREVLLGGSKEM